MRFTQTQLLLGSHCRGVLHPENRPGAGAASALCIPQVGGRSLAQGCQQPGPEELTVSPGAQAPFPKVRPAGPAALGPLQGKRPQLMGSRTELSAPLGTCPPGSLCVPAHARGCGRSAVGGNYCPLAGECCMKPPERCPCTEESRPPSVPSQRFLEGLRQNPFTCVFPFKTLANALKNNNKPYLLY